MPYKESYTYRKNKGVCTCCGGTKESAKYLKCNKCISKQNKDAKLRNKLRKKNNKCVRCGISAVAGQVHKVCEICWFKMIARTRVGVVDWMKIKGKLEEQNYKCAYSGKFLKIGVNTSLDHIIPIARGGSNSIDNLQWVDTTVNKMKSSRTNGEFLSLIKKILKHTNS